MSRRKRRTRRPEGNTTFWGRLFKPDARLLITIGGPLSLIASLFLGQNTLLWFSLPVCYIWSTGIFFAYVLRLVVLGRYVLPPSATHTKEDKSGRHPMGWPSMREGVFLIFYHAFFTLLPSSIRRRLGYGPQEKIPEGLPESLKTYRAGIVPSHLAVTMGSPTSIARTAGPGYVRAGRSEQLVCTFDLRLQHRAKHVSVTSKDGIPLETKVSAVFMVRRPPGPVNESIPYPYEGETLFRLLCANSLETDGKEIHWSERTCPSIEAKLANEISKYYFDELFRSPGSRTNGEETSPEVNIRKSIRENLRQQLRQKFEYDDEDENPILIIDAGYGDLTPPSEVINQRIDSWRAKWEMEQERERIQSEAEAIITHRLARANAQIQMIDSVTSLLANIHDTPNVGLSEVITLRLLEAMDRIIEEKEDSPARQKVIDENQFSEIVALLRTLLIISED